MLLEINIKNFIIIEHEIITLSQGLNIISGETGSGKSLVIEALSAITGGRFSKDDIRTGADKASIEAIFSIVDQHSLIAELEEYGIDMEDDGTLLITREVNHTGRSICRINGQIVTLSMLKRVSQYLIDIVGQNEHRLLFNVSKHGEYVDSFGGERLKSLKNDVVMLVQKLDNLKYRLDKISGNSIERERKLDLLQFQIDEIDGANLIIGEDEELKNKRHLLINAEKLLKGITNTYFTLYKSSEASKSVSELLNESVANLNELTAIDQRLDKLRTAAEGLLYQLEDIQTEMRSYRDNIEYDEKEIDIIEERIDIINKLKRKYGATIEEVLKYKDEINIEYESIKNSEKLAVEIENEIKIIKTQYMEKSKALSAARKKCAEKLEKLIEKELKDLNMQGSKFVIAVSEDDKKIDINGINKMEFLLSANPGEPEKPLSKIASGGEMSRVMLAIKNAFSQIEKVPCFVFDEVDSGVGGQTANAVGQKIKSISKNAQIICITHLAQIACLADNHIAIEKQIKGNKTYTKMKVLKEEERICEIARMLGGNKNMEASIEHARKLVVN